MVGGLRTEDVRLRTVDGGQRTAEVCAKSA